MSTLQKFGAGEDERWRFPGQKVTVVFSFGEPLKQKKPNHENFLALQSLMNHENVEKRSDLNNIQIYLCEHKLNLR